MPKKKPKLFYEQLLTNTEKPKPLWMLPALGEPEDYKLQPNFARGVERVFESGRDYEFTALRTSDGWSIQYANPDGKVESPIPHLPKRGAPIKNLKSFKANVTRSKIKRHVIDANGHRALVN